MPPGTRLGLCMAIDDLEELGVGHAVCFFGARGDVVKDGDLIGSQGWRVYRVVLYNAHDGWTRSLCRVVLALHETLLRGLRPAAGGPARVGLALRAAVWNV